MNDFKKKQQKNFAAKLLRWYRKHRRELPFRGTDDPYTVWVSEMMLQQTQVATMLPYFERFMERFPTVKELAEAPLDEVLSCWAGLGYYRRARYLHAGAKQIVGDHDGKFPGSRSELLKLPGIGPYTAGAILSIAFNQPEPLLDGNVQRVLCRVFELAGDPEKGETHRRLWLLAEGLIPEGEAGDYNQAMMELGALVCSPKSPGCEQCPVSDFCGAKRNGRVDEFPQLRNHRPSEKVESAAALIRHRGRYLIAQRRPEAVLGGLWEFPLVERTGKLPARSLLRRGVRRMVGLEVEVGDLLTKVQHTIMKRRICLEAFECRVASGKAAPLAYDSVSWVRPADFEKFALSSAPAQIVKALMQKNDE